MNLIYLINEAGEAVISILAVLIVSALVYVLYYTWNKERIRIKQEKAIYIEGLKTKQELQSDISQYIDYQDDGEIFNPIKIIKNEITQMKVILSIQLKSVPWLTNYNL